MRRSRDPHPHHDASAAEEVHREIGQHASMHDTFGIFTADAQARDSRLPPGVLTHFDHVARKLQQLRNAVKASTRSLTSTFPLPPPSHPFGSSV